MNKSRISLEFTSLPLTSLLLENNICSLITSLPSIKILDVGCGTSLDSFHFLENIYSYKMGHFGGENDQISLYLLDKNISWLLSTIDNIREENRYNLDVHGIHANILEPDKSRYVSLQGNLSSYQSIREKFHIILLHSDMVSWFPFFETETKSVFDVLTRLVSPEGLLVITRTKGQPIHSFNQILDSWFLDSCCLLQKKGNSSPFILKVGNGNINTSLILPSDDVLITKSVKTESVYRYYNEHSSSSDTVFSALIARKRN